MKWASNTKNAVYCSNHDIMNSYNACIQTKWLKMYVILKK